jgi:ribosomal protein S18 acetylase RimI-like enzyme
VNCSFLEKEKTMTKEDFIGIGQRAGTFDQSGLTFLTFEDLQDYEILQDSPKGILLKGFNSFQKKNELVFACNDETEFLKMTSSYSGYMVQFVSPAWKEDLRRRGFKVLGDMRDYWIQDLSGYSGDRTLDFGEEKEAEQISGVTRDCAEESREFAGESPKFILAWLQGSEPNLLEAQARSSQVLVKRVDGKIVGVALVAVYGVKAPKGAICWLRELAVLRRYQHQGFGRSLVLDALAYGKSLQAKRAFLSADEENLSARHLYLSCGFLPKEDEEQLDLITPIF